MTQFHKIKEKIHRFFKSRNVGSASIMTLVTVLMSFHYYIQNEHKIKRNNKLNDLLKDK